MKTHQLLFFFLFTLGANATNIRGYVKDSASADPIVGATIHLKNTTYATFADLDGSFVLKNIPDGSYIIVASFIGYQTVEKTIKVYNGKDLSVKFELHENTKQLQEVEITAAMDQGSEAKSRKIEQNSDNVVSVLSAKAIQLSPDVTVGNVMQRVSGVSIVRNGSGDGQYAVIRGMEQRYNYTTVNGIKIPSPDNKNRYIPMDIFPAELLERLEVVKALTPNMEGDAIGGAMNMAMKSAPSSYLVSASVAGGYSSILANHPFSTFNSKAINLKAPSEIHGNSYVSQISDYSINQFKYKTVPLPLNSTYALTIGNRFFKSKLGVLIAASYQNMYRGHNGLFYVVAEQPNAGNVVSNNGIENRNYSSLQKRGGVHLNLDYSLGKTTKLHLYNIFAQLDETQHRYREEIRTTEVGEYSSHDRSMFQRQRVNSTSFKIDQTIAKKIKLNLLFNYALATNIIPDQVELNVKTKVDRNSTTGQLLDPGYYINDLTHKWYHNSDKDKGAYYNVIYNIIPAIEISAGGLYKNKVKDNYYTENKLSCFPFAPGQPYTNIDNVNFIFSPTSNANADTTDPKNYVAIETIKAAYIQSKIVIAKKLQIVGGIRAERTLQSYTSAISPLLAGKSGSVTYIDYLPSVHFKFMLNKLTNIRASYFKGISRPALFELIDAPNQGDYYTETGNPILKHTRSSNYDLRYEYFPKTEEQIIVGVFYKNIINPIEFSFAQRTNNGYVYQPSNFGNATNYGFELVIAKFYKKFGLSGNYTFTESSITTEKRVINENGVPNAVLVTRPLQGQSKHIGNVSFIYKNSKLGLDSRISVVYTGERISVVSAYYGLDYWQRPTTQLDFSGEKKISKRFVVYAKITNLLNSKSIIEIRTPLPDYFKGNPGQTRNDRVLTTMDAYGQTYLVGLRFKL
jgi:outer membrane receptor protein involved in Fe transport